MELTVVTIILLVMLVLTTVLLVEYSKKDKELNRIRDVYLRDMQMYKDEIKVLKTELLITR